MYLHIGQGKIIDTADIVGIFDLDVTSQSHLTREYLRKAEQDGQVENVSEDIPKTYIVCSTEEKETIYLSQPATATLLRRAATGLN